MQRAKLYSVEVGFDSQSDKGCVCDWNRQRNQVTCYESVPSSSQQVPFSILALMNWKVRLRRSRWRIPRLKSSNNAFFFSLAPLSLAKPPLPADIPFTLPTH